MASTDSSVGTSGSIILSTFDGAAGPGSNGGTGSGISGNIVLSTGQTKRTGETSGPIYIGTGTSSYGPGGSISVTVGSGYSGVGGDITLSAGAFWGT